MSWALAYACMFGGFFLYVLSAPVFLMEHLGLGETDFLWMFGPATVGLMLGSALAGRLSQRWSTAATLKAGFSIMAAATLWNLAVCLVEPGGTTWYVAYLLYFNLGMSVMIPTITVRGLDCVPERRGTGSSVQLFIQTGFNAWIAAVLAPLMWHSLLSLALGAAALALCGVVGVVAADRLSS